MKFSGTVGFWCNDAETKPGFFQPEIKERPYTGDVLRDTRRFQASSDTQNDSFKVNSQISIVSDLYMTNNWPSIRYVVWNGTRLKVTGVDPSTYPRVILEIGGEYHGENAN